MIKPLIESIKLLDISDEEYFSDKYKDYISNSRLRLINPAQGGNKELYKKGLVHDYNESLALGSAIHQIILQPEEFEVCTVVDKPTAKMGIIADELYNIYKDKDTISNEDIISASNIVDYYKGMMTDDRCNEVLNKCTPYWIARKKHEENEYYKTQLYLDIKNRQKVELCVDSVNNNIEIQNLLHPRGLIEEPISVNEGTLLLDIEVNGKLLKLKAKLDNFTIDFENNTITLNDLKTTGHWLTKFRDSYIKYHYTRQMAMYLWMLSIYVRQEYKMENPNMYANMLVITTVPDYRAGVFKVYNSHIKQGFEEFKSLINMVSCIGEKI